MSLEWHQRRIARNEAQFREINERLQSGLRQVRHTPEQLPFICECGSRECDSSVLVTFEEYEAVRSDSRRSLVVPGHVFPEVERVVAGNDRYEVVEKIGEAIDVTDVTDPRGRRRSDTPMP